MNQDAAINKLLLKGAITRSAIRGRYYVCDAETATFRREDILNRFTTQYEPGNYTIIWSEVERALNWNRPVLRTIRRDAYHTQDRDYDTALARIAPDADGYVRSFGIEYEIYDLNEEQEDKLARLLDTLPEHITERDGSLGSRGVEIVFMPVGAADYVRIVKTLADFVRQNNVRMDDGGQVHMSGMHTTYGISKEGFVYPNKADLQIRLNRLALSVKAVGTQRQIKRLFGRDFGNYRDLPTSTTYSTHSNAFSTYGRTVNCWECRLTDWKCDAERMIEFFKVTERAYFGPVGAAAFSRIFDILGADTDGE